MNPVSSRPSDASMTQLSQHEWAGIRTELIWIYDSVVLAHNRDTMSNVKATHKVWYIRQGNVRIQPLKQKPCTGSKGDWLFLPKTPCNHHFSSNSHILSLNFLCQWPSGENLIAEDQIGIVPGKTYPRLQTKANRLRILAHKLFPDLASHYARQLSGLRDFLKLQSLFLEWLDEWLHVRLKHGAKMSIQRANDDRVLQAVRLLNQAPLDEAFPKALLEQETRIGEPHLNRLFIQNLNMTTRHYWNQRRLEFAKNCLGTSGMPVKEVAYRLGFRSDSHFVVWFQRLAGTRPSHFRKNFNNFP